MKHRLQVSEYRLKLSNNLLDLIHEIRSNNITDNELEMADLHDVNTGKTITTSMIETRLKELG